MATHIGFLPYLRIVWVRNGRRGLLLKSTGFLSLFGCGPFQVWPGPRSALPDWKSRKSYLLNRFFYFLQKRCSVTVYRPDLLTEKVHFGGKNGVIITKNGPLCHSAPFQGDDIC